MVRRWVGDFLLVLVPVILVAGWWYWRNWQLYGDPTGLAVMLEIAGRRPAAPSLATLLGEFQGFRINFWGLFGAVNVLMRPAWIYTLLDLLTLAAVARLCRPGFGERGVRSATRSGRLCCWPGPGLRSSSSRCSVGRQPPWRRKAG